MGVFDSQSTIVSTALCSGDVHCFHDTTPNSPEKPLKTPGIFSLKFQSPEKLHWSLKVVSEIISDDLGKYCMSIFLDAHS